MPQVKQVKQTMPATEQNQGHSAMKMATYASLSAALLLLGVKAAAWLATDSVSMLASLLDSAVDAVASLITMLAVRESLKPADDDHRFGHGKLEPLAGLGQALLIAVSAGALLNSAIHRLITPEPLHAGALGIAVMVFASAVTLLLVRFQRRVVAQTGSTAVDGDSMHYTSDLYMNLGVMLSLAGATWLGWQWLDPVLGILIAGIIGHSAWQIGLKAVHLLMDSEFDPALRKQIEDVVRAQRQVYGLHDLRTRRSGTQDFVQFHLELDGEMPLHQAHAICDEVAAAVQQLLPRAEVIVHADPRHAS